MVKRSKKYVSLYHDDNTGKDFVRVTALGLDFLIPLHDEFLGRDVTYDRAIQFDLPDEKKARIIGFFRKEINELLERSGGDPIKTWYWTSTPACEVFGAGSAYVQLLFDGSYGCLNYDGRFGSYRVRVALDFDTYISNKS